MTLLIVVEVIVDNLEVLMMDQLSFRCNSFVRLGLSLRQVVNAELFVAVKLDQSCTMPIKLKQQIVDVRLSESKLVIICCPLVSLHAQRYLVGSDSEHGLFAQV